MESDMRSSLLIGRIFVDEPASTSSENALVLAFDETKHDSVFALSAQVTARRLNTLAKRALVIRHPVLLLEDAKRFDSHHWD